jgi:pimeloyl-ACP methyl ester carboxylesterase
VIRQLRFAFYQQLQSLNLEQVWQGMNAPLLVIYGTGDTVMSRADSDAISETVNRVHPGTAQNYIVDRMNHLFQVDEALRISEWGWASLH